MISVGISPERLCKNCGRLIGGHCNIGNQFYCYPYPDEYDVFEQNKEYRSIE
jgi:hypothetical protein